MPDTIVTSDRRILGFGPFLQRLHVGLDSFKRIDAARSSVSSRKVLSVEQQGPLMLPYRLVNTGNTIKTICDKRASTLNALSALPVGKFILTPAYEPPVDFQGLFISLQHVERSRITPDCQRAIRLNLK